MEENKGQKNCINATITDLREGVLLVQAADIALKHIEAKLNRMLELANLAANGEYDDVAGRKALDDEFQLLNLEIDDIVQTAAFDGMKMLDGTVRWTISP